MANLNSADYYYKQTWLGLLDTERCIRYYAYMANHMRGMNRSLTFIILLASTGAFLALTRPLPSVFDTIVRGNEIAEGSLSQLYVSLILSIVPLVISAITIMMAIYDYSGKAEVANSIRIQYQDLSLEWRELLITGPSAQEVKRLKLKFHKIATVDTVETDHDLNRMCAEEAYEEVTLEFQT